MMCGWLSGAGCASTRRCEKALLQPAPRVRKPDDARRMLAELLQGEESAGRTGARCYLSFYKKTNLCQNT